MKFQLFISAFMACMHNACASDKFINITKVTPCYWRATFSSPPLEIEGLSFFTEYYALIHQIATDRTVKVVVFDSNSPYYWLNHFDLVNHVPYSQSWATYWGNVTLLASLPVLTIAAIQGHTSGGGAEIAATLDIRFGSQEKAIYTQPEVGLGVVPGGGGLEMLPRLVGRSRALEIVLAANDMDADTAAAYGWLNRAIPDAQFEQFVDSYARRVASWDKASIAAAKDIINRRSGFPTAAEWKESYDTFLALLHTSAVQDRLDVFEKAGLQENLTLELDTATGLLDYAALTPC